MQHGPMLEVNLSAVARNYTLLAGRLGAARCAAVVKADAYGLGAAAVAPALYKAGCRIFFVANAEEGVTLRKILPRAEANICVFHGLRAGEEKDFTAYGLIPVLNDGAQLGLWNDRGPYILHVDTGMRRLGFNPKEAERLAEKGPDLRPMRLIMSHLACANEPENPMNREQRDLFKAAAARFPGVRASLANSSGIFLGHDYAFDLARPGCSLYGISPDTARPNPMEHVATLSAPVLQYRTLEREESVGYGATAMAKAGTVLATVELGYADGFLRSLSNKAHGFAGGVRVPTLGRVSMDMVCVDVTAVPEAQRVPDLRIAFISPEQPVDALAREAGTIGYEIFTRLGTRVHRVYGQEA